MVMAQTSLDAYRSIVGKLGRKQATVLNVFQGSQSLTNMEVAEILGWSINRVTGRVYELRGRSLLKEDRKRFCSITGIMCMTWKRTLRCLGDAFD